MNVEYLLTIILHVTDQIKSNKMDAALLAEREAFKRRAMAVPTIENKKRKTDIGTAAKSGFVSEQKNGFKRQDLLLHWRTRHKWGNTNQQFSKIL